MAANAETNWKFEATEASYRKDEQRLILYHTF